MIFKGVSIGFEGVPDHIYIKTDVEWHRDIVPGFKPEYLISFSLVEKQKDVEFSLNLEQYCHLIANGVRWTL